MSNYSKFILIWAIINQLIVVIIVAFLMYAGTAEAGSTVDNLVGVIFGSIMKILGPLGPYYPLVSLVAVTVLQLIFWIASGFLSKYFGLVGNALAVTAILWVFPPLGAFVSIFIIAFAIWGFYLLFFLPIIPGISHVITAKNYA